ncbi:hypothetical protein J0X15_09435 [Roseibium sp. CAU 1637]|uniref:Thermonuclease family protein n=1 Tax=Roseibium limicola TaxID=2816037 RepID=A0A939J8L7_9HYPH|nr:hypothetical protein [Roseibium limicola]MBO0345441.1 hypothetical protein [Roseibium limicola]
MPPRAIALPVLLLVVAGSAVAWLKLAPPPAVPETSSAEHNASSTFLTASRKRPEVAAPREQDQPASAAPLPHYLRNVAPSGIPAPEVSGPLLRVEARLPEIRQPEPEALPTTGDLIVIRRPQVVSAGTLTGNHLTLHLAHVDALASKDTCPSDLGTDWPCGALARTALRAVVRIYAVTCKKTADIGEREISAICERGPLNLSRWLVEYGWAVPDDTAPEDYTELAAVAKEEGRGQWKRDWEPLLVDSDEADTYAEEQPQAKSSGSSSVSEGGDADLYLDSLSQLEMLPSRNALPEAVATGGSSQNNAELNQ